MTLLTTMVAIFAASSLSILAQTSVKSQAGTASWYGEAHRGKLMANGKPFNPDHLTAASWFYPLGSKVRVTSLANRKRSVVVTVTDRGPATRLVANGRVIDLGRAAFLRLADPHQGLVAVEVKLLPARKG